MDKALKNRLKKQGMTEEGFQAIKMYFRENKRLQTIRKKRKEKDIHGEAGNGLAKHGKA